MCGVAVAEKRALSIQVNAEWQNSVGQTLRSRAQPAGFETTPSSPQAERER